MNPETQETDNKNFVLMLAFQIICLIEIINKCRNDTRFLTIAPAIFVMTLYYRRNLRPFIIPVVLWTIGFVVFYENFYAGAGLWVASVWFSKKNEPDKMKHE